MKRRVRAKEPDEEYRGVQGAQDAVGSMSIFTPSHLGRWEALYSDLMTGERMSLTLEGTWMLAEKPGLVAVFDSDEVVYVAGTRNIAKTLQGYLKGGSACEFRTLTASVDLGVSQKTAEKRAKDGQVGQRVDKLVARLRYRVAPAQPSVLDAVARAFVAVADPRFNGPTAQGNLAIDALPK